MKKDQLEKARKDPTAQLEAANKRIAEMEKHQNNRPPVATGDDIRVDLLHDAVLQSCNDHCPQRENESACKNCSIADKIRKAGFEPKHN